MAGQRLAVPPVPDAPTPARLALVLTAAVLAISSAAPLVRVADAPAASLAFARVAISALLLLGLLAASSRSRPTGRFGLSALAGLLLALHFYTWFESLRFISVAVSTLLVTLSPLWVSLASIVLPKEHRPGPRGWLGMAVALAGAALLVGLHDESGGFSLRGAALATTGGVLAAAYFLVSRAARATTALLPFAFVANATAALVLAPVMLRDQTAWSTFSPVAWCAIFGLAALPQLVGHNGLSWALRWIPATTVSMVVLLEPIGAGLLAALFLGENLPAVDFVAGAIILCGLALVLRDSSRSSSPATT